MENQQKNTVRLKGAMSKGGLIYLALSALVLPTVCFADMGIPVIIISYPAMAVALLAIIPVEAFLLKKYLNQDGNDSRHGIGRYVKASASANIVSTLLGFPLAWLFLFLVEMITIPLAGAAHRIGFDGLDITLFTNLLAWAWLGPGGDGSGTYVLIFIAWVINLILAFFLSVWAESYIVGKFFKEIEKEKLKKAVLKVNLISYSLLIVGMSIYLLIDYLALIK